jgi:hypothetical protein
LSFPLARHSPAILVRHSLSPVIPQPILVRHSTSHLVVILQRILVCHSAAQRRNLLLVLPLPLPLLFSCHPSAKREDLLLPFDLHPSSQQEPRRFDRSRSRIYEQRGGEIRFSKSTSAKPTPRPARTLDPTTCHPERSRSRTLRTAQSKDLRLPLFVSKQTTKTSSCDNLTPCSEPGYPIS